MIVRARFSTDEIARCALEIVESDGLSGLSMRAVASRLATGPMTLYNYVEGREGLEELVVEAIIAGIVLPSQAPDWRTDFTAVCTALWEGLRHTPT